MTQPESRSFSEGGLMGKDETLIPGGVMSTSIRAESYQQGCPGNIFTCIRLRKFLDLFNSL